MSDGRVHPEVFAGAATETARDADPRRDVEIAASFSAQRLRHLERPRARIWVSAGGELEKVDDATRKNLPDRVEAGRTYTDVRGRRHVGGRARTPAAGEVGEDGT